MIATAKPDGARTREDGWGRWFFTFGTGHPLKARYVQITGGYASARELMSWVFGARWAFQYSQMEWDNNRYRRDLTPVAVLDVSDYTDLLARAREEQ